MIMLYYLNANWTQVQKYQVLCNLKLKELVMIEVDEHSSDDTSRVWDIINSNSNLPFIRALQDSDTLYVIGNANVSPFAGIGTFIDWDFIHTDELLHILERTAIAYENELYSKYR